MCATNNKAWQRKMRENCRRIIIIVSEHSEI